LDRRLGDLKSWSGHGGENKNTQSPGPQSSSYT